jgi:hypothetical protein
MTIGNGVEALDGLGRRRNTEINRNGCKVWSIKCELAWPGIAVATAGESKILYNTRFAAVEAPRAVQNFTGAGGYHPPQ